MRCVKKNLERNDYKFNDLTKLVYKNWNFIDNLRIYTDYQWCNTIGGQYGISRVLVSRDWYVWDLTDINQWSPCLQIDQNVIAAAKTHVSRSKLNCRVDIDDTTQVSYINVFLVSLRKDATNVLEIFNEVTGAMTPLSVDTDHIFNLNGADIILNSAKFKMHAAKYITLTQQASTTSFPVGHAVGNPYSFWRKWQWNIKYGFNVRSSEGATWRSIKFDQMQKFYLLTYSVSLGQQQGPTLNVTW